MSNWIQIVNTDDFMVDYDKTKNMYRVSYFQDNHYVDEIVFKGYNLLSSGYANLENSEEYNIYLLG